MKCPAVGAAILALGVVGPLCADDMPQSPNVGVPWYTRWFGIGTPPPRPAPPPRRRDPAAESARVRAQAEADLLRQLKVCDQLREVAMQTNNADLLSKVDDLERQATELYKQRTAYLPCSKLMPTQSESELDRQLDATSSPADRLTTPAISVPTRTSQASNRREGTP